ncbi:MAG: endonuclease/exonuclease/phosphatase family protein [bacterium]
MSTRIATWNLNRGKAAWRRDAIMEQMRRVDADIWIVTETRDAITPGEAYKSLSRSKRSEEHEEDESWVEIWSRLHAMTTHATSDPFYSASATVNLRSGVPLTVFGTVLPWSGRSWGGLPSAAATAFKAALATQAADWLAFPKAHGGLYCVAGDFNQDLADMPYYWSLQAREALTRTLLECDLTATTAGNLDPVVQLTGGTHACIDHICVSHSLALTEPGAATAWSPQVPRGVLSDHPGVWIDVAAG